MENTDISKNLNHFLPPLVMGNLTFPVAHPAHTLPGTGLTLGAFYTGPHPFTTPAMPGKGGWAGPTTLASWRGETPGHHPPPA